MKSKSILIKSIVGFTFFVVVLIISNLVLFTVDTTEYVVVTQFGKPVRSIVQAGLNTKLPDPIQTLYRYDNRQQIYEAGDIELLTKDKKSVVVDHYGVWKIKDPVLFMKTVKDKTGAEQRLSDVFSSVLGAALGQYELRELVNVDREQMKLDQMLSQVAKRCDAQTVEYGITVTDVAIRTLNFPEKNKLSVFRRMKAEREQMARKYRSEGSEEAAKIRAEATKEQKTILSEAYMRSQQIMGEGDAEAIRIYAEAFQKDPKFYEFIRTLEAYEKFIDDKTTAILPADSDLLKYLNSGSSKRR
ncbi:TPA: protease modulator HflC [Candidatus Poribacteria bacterium]|nr:protease modulator HflC [Candidatus Poribacteria bacterium]